MSARTISFLASAAAFATQLFAAEGNMYGNQTQNEGLCVVPRTQSVAINGDFSDWDLSGQIWSFADWDSRDTFSVRSAAMWDEDGLYLAFDWRDPLPLNSKVNPLENRDKGWQTDAIQLRSLTHAGRPRRMDNDLGLRGRKARARRGVLGLRRQARHVVPAQALLHRQARRMGTRRRSRDRLQGGCRRTRFHAGVPHSLVRIPARGRETLRHSWRRSVSNSTGPPPLAADGRCTPTRTTSSLAS